MFNLPMKQVHNLLRSTYCHWPGPAITWNCCFSNQVIWAMTLGGRGWWDGQEEKALGVSCVGVVFFTTAMLRHLGADHSTQSWFSQAAVRRCTPILHSCRAHCKMTMALLSRHKHKLFFLPRHPSRSVQVAPQTVHQRPWNCLLPPLSCSLLPRQGHLLRKAQPITFGVVQRSHWPGRDLVATLSENPHAMFSEQERLSRKTEGGRWRRGRVTQGISRWKTLGGRDWRDVMVWQFNNGQWLANACMKKTKTFEFNIINPIYSNRNLSLPVLDIRLVSMHVSLDLLHLERLSTDHWPATRCTPVAGAGLTRVGVRSQDCRLQNYICICICIYTCVS